MEGTLVDPDCGVVGKRRRTGDRQRGRAPLLDAGGVAGEASVNVQCEASVKGNRAAIKGAGAKETDCCTPSRNDQRRVERIGSARAIAINRQITHCAGTLASQGAIRVDLDVTLNPVGHICEERAIVKHHIVPCRVRVGEAAAQGVLAGCT